MDVGNHFSFNELQVVIAITLAGVSGGIANYLLGYVADAQGRSTDLNGNGLGAHKRRWLFNRDLVTSIILGIVASFMVPLFLQVGQSTLIDKIMGHGPIQNRGFESLLVLIGFCLVASISAKRFIENVSDKVLKKAAQDAKVAQTQAKATAEKADEILANLEEDELPDGDGGGTEEQNMPTHDLKKETISIMQSMYENPLVRRSVTGLAKDTGQKTGAVLSNLDILTEKELVHESASVKHPGQSRYKLTSEGRKEIRNIITHDISS